MSEMFSYWGRYYEKFLTALWQHLGIVLETLVISLLLAAVITVLARKSERVSNWIVRIFSGVYSIPSLALFAILIPVTGLGRTTTILVLVVYNQFLLLRNIFSGLSGVDRNLLEAATGMGMSDRQVLTRVQLPLAMPMVIAGIRLATVSTIGIATIAATINAGGLGTILFDGLRTNNIYKLVGGTLLCALIAILSNALLKWLENAVRKRQGQV